MNLIATCPLCPETTHPAARILGILMIACPAVAPMDGLMLNLHGLSAFRAYFHEPVAARIDDGDPGDEDEPWRVSW